jgi:flagellin
LRINTNIASLTAQRNLSNTTKALSRAMERLASGKRINSARDDAAGLAISEGLNSQVRGLARASQNMNEAQGFLQTADGAMAEQMNLVQRMRELAMQSANGTLSKSDRSSLDLEYQQLLQEFARIANQTSFNGVKLLDGSFGTKSVQVGVNKGESMDLTLPSTADYPDRWIIAKLKQKLPGEIYLFETVSFEKANFGDWIEKESSLIPVERRG